MGMAIKNDIRTDLHSFIQQVLKVPAYPVAVAVGHKTGVAAEFKYFFLPVPETYIAVPLGTVYGASGQTFQILRTPGRIPAVNQGIKLSPELTQDIFYLMFTSVIITHYQ